MNDTKTSLEAIFQTLNQLEVKGFDNLDRLYGCLILLKRIIDGMEENNG